MIRYSITAPALNFRSSPSSADNHNVIDVLSFGTVLELLEKTNEKWWNIKVADRGLEGFVSSRYLKLHDEAPVIANSIIKADYANDPRSSLFTKRVMYKPVGHPDDIPYRDESSHESRLASLQTLVNILNVTQNQRYLRDTYTYCNIYAYDFLHFCNIYIPRVWWNQGAIKRLLRGERVELLYGTTVSEQRVNDIHDWFLDWGDDFGWQRKLSVDDLQSAVNKNAGVGVIMAKRKVLSRSGHITVVLPETETHKAYREDGIVRIPLQSQAGAVNRKYFTSKAGLWWTKERYSSFLFYYHD